MKLVSERASDMKRSMPRISARPATGIEGTTYYGTDASGGVIIIKTKTGATP